MTDTITISRDARPRLPRGLRLQWEPAQQSHVLLYPEGMVVLNPTAAAILERCDGERSVDALIADLESAFGETDLAADILEFLSDAHGRRWIEFA